MERRVLSSAVELCGPQSGPPPRSAFRLVRSRTLCPVLGAHERSGPISRVLSWTAIYLRAPLPVLSSTQPERSAGHTMALLFALAPEGACQAAWSPRRWWSLTPPFQLFSHPPERAAGVFFSAALSVGSPRLAVSQLPALWSPDFPHSTLPISWTGTPRLSGPLCMGDCITFIRLEAPKSNNLQVNETLRVRGFLATR